MSCLAARLSIVPGHSTHYTHDWHNRHPMIAPACASSAAATLITPDKRYRSEKSSGRGSVSGSIGNDNCSVKPFDTGTARRAQPTDCERCCLSYVEIHIIGLGSAPDLLHGTETWA
ncbi:hypothetical protein COCC4DRAFT_29493 [Bipolaris maydis ATCC 48331]|uniref:Uncharacterized protein n=1 Tax=Cochliobolus heterostrophus (strain C4 / ATCC 48331 / race T) TaxID=665024 RepID=N4XWV0_COCH4|nr:uncharacterized protein COCC4DRAFT_29493 [Bipolaris maydis ATCC 48331]ENI10881.1 hypothetical protein COCC4DRAFT_29493 [Bipolaris maydis ATCC 48331]KAH7561901.1 hypothetical protein BM1_03005 [Bipolaris maydis]